MTLRAAAAALNVAPATAHRWWHRYQDAGPEGRASTAWLCDRSSRPNRQPRRLTATQEAPILRARRETNLGPGRLAGICRCSRSTIWKVLHRHGLSQRRRSSRQTYRRYEWSRPGALLHVDVARLSRFERPGHAVTGIRDKTGAEKRAGVGYVYLHCVIDDNSRYAYVEQHRDQGGHTAAAVLERAIEHFAALGLKGPEAVMSDNAFAYRKSNPSGRPWWPTAPATSSPRLTHRAGTGRSRDSSKPSSRSGPTPTPGPTQPSGPGPWHPSCATTTGVARTAPWETGHRSAVFTTSVGGTASCRSTAARPRASRNRRNPPGRGRLGGRTRGHSRRRRIPRSP
jgi:transposase